MKNIFKTLVPCLVLAMGLTGCYDEMDDKAIIDAKYALDSTPTVSISAASANDHSSATVSASISAVEGVVETGFMVAGSSDFSDAKSYVVETSTSITSQVTDLAESTNYFVKAYAYMADGRLIYSEQTSFTTQEAPSYELAGTYAATEYDASTGEVADNYDVTIAFAEGSETQVEITNFWAGGKTVVGTFDAATNTVTIPTGQLIYVHASYGDVFMMAIDSSTNYIDAITCQFTPKGGFLKTSYWASVCSAGTFGYSWVEMAHK